MTRLFEEGALSLDNLLDPGAEAGAGPRHLLPGHVGEPGHDGGLQGVQSVVGALLMVLSQAPQK